MNKKVRYIIKPNHVFGRKLNGSFFIAIWLLLNQLHAGQWLWGIYWFVVALFVIGFIVDLIIVDERHVDLELFLKDRYEERKQQPEKKESKPAWEERLAEKMNEKQ